MLAMWGVFFVFGLFPEPVFYALRDLAAVSSHRALVNNAGLVTLAFSAYLGLFAFRRCKEMGAGSAESQGRGMQVAILALIAFLEIPRRTAAVEVTTLLQLMARFQEIPDNSVRAFVLLIGACKVLAAWYLYSLLFRYHAFGMRDAFLRMPSLFLATSPRRSIGAPQEPEPAGSLEPPVVRTDTGEEPPRS